MRFLIASELWWLLLGLLIILFYLLKIRRKRALVSTVMLWKRALDELEANAPFRRLRRNLLLALQLIALALIVLSLARPAVVTRALASGNTIIIIDSTASMGSRDEDGGSRLDRAKQIATRMIGDLSGSDRASVIESSSRVTVRCPLTSDRNALRTAIGDIKSTDAPGDLSDAIRLASELAHGENETSIIVIGDGGAPQRNQAGQSNAIADTRNTGPSIRFVRVGKRSENVGIIAFNSRRLSISNKLELFASIANFGSSNRNVEVELKLDGNLIDARTVSIVAGDKTSLVFESLPENGGLAEAKLDVDDDLESDNVAYAVVPTSRRTRVGLMSDNPFLIQALAANPDIEVTSTSSSTNASQFGQYDCLIADKSAVGEAISSSRSVLLIDPPDVPGLIQTVGTIEHPQISSIDRSHPINAFLSYSDIHIESAPRRTAGAWLKTIVSSGSDPLVWAGEDGHRRAAIIGFDPAKSDLPLKVEFPILLANSVAWLSMRDSLSDDRAVRCGQTAAIRLSGSSATITEPDGTKETAEAREGIALFADTLRAGRYSVKESNDFAASLLAESESNTAPRDSISTSTGEIKGQLEQFSSEREIWRWLALLVLLVLTGEWWIYHRRLA